MASKKLTLPSVLLVFVILSLACAGNQNLSITLKAYEYGGDIDFKFKVNLNQLEKLSHKLAIGSPDTCFVYCHTIVFKNFTVKYDSISYRCLGGKILDSKVMERFGERFKMRFVDEDEAFIKFEPYYGMFQFTIEVGENPRGQENRMYIGYSKKGAGLRPIQSYSDH